MSQSTDCFTPFGYLPRAPGQGNVISLNRGRSPSVDTNTHIPEDRPRGPCILVSLTSLMSSLDHLRGVLSASGKVVSHVLHSNYIIAPLKFVQGLFHIVLGQRPQMSPDFSTLVSPLEGPKQVMSLVISGLRWRQCLEAPTVLRYTFMIDVA